MGPLSKVMECVGDGATTVKEIARRTGLSPATVDAALLQLERMGRARKVTETMACSGACKGCDVECGSRTSPANGAGTVTILKLGSRPV